MFDLGTFELGTFDLTCLNWVPFFTLAPVLQWLMDLQVNGNNAGNGGGIFFTSAIILTGSTVAIVV